MKPAEIQKQVFDFTDADIAAILAEWKGGFAAIPLPEKDFWIDTLHMDEEDRAEIAMQAVYQFIDINPDTWFWIVANLKRDGTAQLEFMCNYSTPDEDRLLPIVNRSMKRIGFEELEELTFPARELNTWQEAYDFFCNLARMRRTAITNPQLTSF